MKIAILVYCLRGGGAERVSATLAAGLEAAGDEVTVITELTEDTDQYRLPVTVKRAIIGQTARSVLGKPLGLVRKIGDLRAYLQREQPDALVSFMTRANNMALIAGRGLPTKIVLCERNDPRHREEAAMDRTARRLLYRRADLLIAQTRGMEQVMRERYGVRSTATIPNPCSVIEFAPPKSQSPHAARYILGMGRLAPQKGFDVLLRAYARSDARKSLDLIIAGFGGERPKLEALAHRLAIADRVHFPGYIESPFTLMAECSMFVLSSRWEGFPNVLLEAMSIGRPVISTDLPSGGHEMIEHGLNGLVVPPEDVAALAEAIDQLAADRDAAERMGERGPAALAPYEPSTVFQAWRRELSQVISAGAQA